MAKDLTAHLEEGLNKIHVGDFLSVSIYKVDGYISIEVRDHTTSNGGEVHPYKQATVDFPKHSHPFTTSDVIYETQSGGDFVEVRTIRFLPLNQKLETLQEARVEE